MEKMSKNDTLNSATTNCGLFNFNENEVKYPDQEKEQLPPTEDGNAEKPIICCPHKKDNKNEKSSKTNKYLITFENTVATGHEDESECISLSKQKCKAFWAFVDSDPKLKGLIKEGEFIHSNKPELINGNKSQAKKHGSEGIKKNLGVKLPTDKELMRMNLGLAEEHKLRKQEAKQRLEKRRALNNALIQKSGQPTTITKPKPSSCTSEKVKLAASETELLSLIFNEMQVYDDDKIYSPKE